jgi:protein tyrosine/serine phosphatase
MQNQDNTDRSQMTSEMKSHEASKQLADEHSTRKAQREAEEQKMLEAQEMEEKDPMDPKNEDGKKRHTSEENGEKTDKDKKVSPKARKYMGGSFFDGYA